MTTGFAPAKRHKKKLRLGIAGPAGSGKTFSALRIAFSLCGCAYDKIFVIDTEHGSAELYAGEKMDGSRWEFEQAKLENYHPTNYIRLIKEAEKAGASVIIIDSLSHAWEGTGGILERVDMAAKQRTGSGKEVGNFAAWKDVIPLQKELIDTILGCKCHVIVTMRTKTEYSVEKDDRGKTQIEKLGTKPVQREGVDYEFDVILDMDTTNTATVTKTRCKLLPMRTQIHHPGRDMAETLLNWLNEGELDTGTATVAAITSVTESATSVEPPGAPSRESERVESEGVKELPVVSGQLPEIPETDNRQPPTTELLPLDEAKSLVQDAMKRGVVTKDQIMQWREAKYVAAGAPLDTFQLNALWSDIQVLEASGKWLPVPF